MRSERERVASDNAQRDKAALEADASEMAQLAVPYEAVIKARGLSSVTLDGRVYYAYVPFPSGHADCTSATDCRLLRMLPVVDCWTLSYRTWYHAPMGAVRKGDSGVFQFPKAGELVEVHLDVLRSFGFTSHGRNLPTPCQASLHVLRRIAVTSTDVSAGFYVA